MGNASSSFCNNNDKQTRVALKVHQDTYAAGDVITGSVYLSVGDRESGLQNVHGLYLLFEGMERAAVEREVSNSNDNCSRTGHLCDQPRHRHHPLNNRHPHPTTRVERREERRREREERRHLERRGREQQRSGYCCSNPNDALDERRLQQNQLPPPRPLPFSSSSGRKSSSSTRTVMDQETAIIVRSDHPVALASQLRVGQFEYPFQWRLPYDLPSSMYCSTNSSISNNNNNNNNNKSFAEIRYTLTAYLAGGGQSSNNSINNNNPAATRAQVPIPITSRLKNNPIRNNGTTTPLVMESERFPIYRYFCCWKQGDIYMGWRLDKSAVCPQEHVTVEIVGENQSRVHVNQILVQWKEIIQWSAAAANNPANTTTSSSSPETKSEVVTRTLAEQVLDNVDDLRCWQPMYKLHASGGGGGEEVDHSSYQPLNQQASSASSPAAAGGLSARLVIPPYARDSYAGRLVRVRHELSVQVRTSGCGSTWPISSSSQVRIVRPENNNNSTASESTCRCTATTTTTMGPADTPITIPEAELLLSTTSAATRNWEPTFVVGEAVVIPEADVILLDSELLSTNNDNNNNNNLSRLHLQPPPPPPMNPALLVTHHDAGITQSRIAAPVAVLPPSAPDESLIIDTGTTTTITTSEQVVQSSSPSPPQPQQEETTPHTQHILLDQLIVIMRDSPEILEAVLQDKAWASFVQNLSPREFCSALQQAGCSSGAISNNNNNNVSEVARVLAKTMYPRFECRHVLACVYVLPETSQRIEILKQTLPFVSDLQNNGANQSLLERELSPAELVHFRSVLQAASSQAV